MQKNLHLQLGRQRRKPLQQRIRLDVRDRREVEKISTLQLAEVRRLKELLQQDDLRAAGGGGADHGLGLGGVGGCTVMKPKKTGQRDTWEENYVCQKTECTMSK